MIALFYKYFSRWIRKDRFLQMTFSAIFLTIVRLLKRRQAVTIYRNRSHVTNLQRIILNRINLFWYGS
jgi:hypothetical protein